MNQIPPERYKDALAKTALTMVPRYVMYKPRAEEPDPVLGGQEEYLNQIHDVINEFLNHAGIKIG